LLPGTLTLGVIFDIAWRPANLSVSQSEGQDRPAAGCLSSTAQRILPWALFELLKTA
jgi:hypothetical protein